MQKGKQEQSREGTDLSYIAALIIIRSMRQDEGEHAQRTGARVHSLCVVQAAGRHNEVMSRDGYGVAHIPTNSHTDIQTHLNNITVLKMNLVICQMNVVAVMFVLSLPLLHVHADLQSGGSKSMERAFMALFPSILYVKGM